MRRFGLIGYPLSHSFSKKYFTEKFQKENIKDCLYENFELENISQLPLLLRNTSDLVGLNVTIPYKTTVLPFVTYPDQVVSRIQSCNCLHITPSGIYGFNTDVIGFETSFVKGLKPSHTKALILGKGGSAKSIEFVLKKLGIQYSFVTRRAGENRDLNWNQLNKQHIIDHKVIINCTPLGMFPDIDEMPAIPYESITADHYLFDLVYNPELTLFLKNGNNRGAFTQNGLEMLVIQAEESWRIWNATR